MVHHPDDPDDHPQFACLWVHVSHIRCPEQVDAEAEAETAEAEAERMWHPKRCLIFEREGWRAGDDARTHWHGNTEKQTNTQGETETRRGGGWLRVGSVLWLVGWM